MSDALYDVVVIGGGPAGSSLSLRLARASCSVALVERTNYDQFRVGESLPPAVATRLMRLGLWNEFLQTKPTAVHGIRSAWGSAVLDCSSFLSHPLSNGWHVDRSKFDLMLGTAAANAGAHVIQKTTALAVSRETDGPWSVAIRSVRGEKTLRARFLVDASGRHSRLCTGLGARRVRFDRMVGIAATCSQESASDILPSLVEADPMGWWYSAGLPNGLAIAIFFTDSDLCKQYRLADPVIWRALLDKSLHTQQRFEGCLFSPRVTAFPAVTSGLDRGAGRCWAVIGDSLIGRDPLSSSGIDFALASADRAFELLTGLANGSSDCMEDCNEALRSDLRHYLVQRGAYYSMETRWPEAPFWKRRHAAVN